ncbi:cytochrome P450 [Ponticoccus sp. SC2-23]|uniref:cytochrome P450 n=1 Tax=Alexandriicola marinus TaxID=2081710 RepID=UPI000FDA649D|nr:cytochrome P450 [Alexandriicola marinus]MBM1219450.1 cytochrome P450 [Ponticoccus sp. SC6-9]MBM1223478.1 cytochrome P450 [Ponticoccus sp. SC6-15]MBM1229263.1 cytochrome P450 [Ponticoccus sp. SC6-38]MBM1232444.1 cytochrome P450 [Ponticoccus sp. SC6-45]MBM1237606.1 cytochrome P450 [Ponticoccus sp. SC6-49]MBM1241455.1 cytochrome P450 [Ponticoccus sp. SC2-64]MBM1245968.1 cytochrome P450 [Ponticoccus sp. SC6-42]MBM1250446.1 cytochrome P450 [Ponticoccus sp. SC6-33]MBM1255615.1 cytochrome P450
MTFDLTDPDFLRAPGPMLAQMRTEGPIVRARIPFMGEVYLTTTDEAARRLLKATDSFARDPGHAGGRSYQKIMWWMPPFMRPLMHNMLLHDGAAHKRLRSLVDQAFARHAMLDLRPEIMALADGLLDQIDPDRPQDMVAAYARPLPLQVICLLLGIPESDRARVQRWISPISAPVNGWAMLRAFPGLYRLIRYFRAEFADVRRTGGRPGLIRDLVLAEQDGDRLSEDELLSMVVMLFIAGHETTVHLVSNGIAGCIDAGNLGPELANSPGRMAIAVEEFMRFYTPVMMTKPLFARHDTEFEGTPLRTGDKIVALLIGANHDPARVEAPSEMRPERRPNPHLGFGHGPHVCLGIQLARIEAQVAIERLFLRYPNAQFAVRRDEIVHGRRIGLRGLPRLPLRLRPA